MAQERPEKGAHVWRSNMVVVDVETEAAVPMLGTEGEAREDGQAIMALPVPEQGRLAARRSGPPHRRDQEEARFVDEDEVGAQPRGVFFTRAQSRCFHRAMAASSRWSARRSGFCGVQPH
jgi:hypothetical protein